MVLRKIRPEYGKTIPKFYLGIDPGKTGGLGLINIKGLYVDAWRMPEEASQIRTVFAEVKRKTSDDLVAVLEKSQAMPSQGVCSMFNYGMRYGILKGLLEALDIQTRQVVPRTWKKYMFDDKEDRRNKAASVRECLRIFPRAQLIPERCRKPSDGIAEALLIAEYERLINLEGKFS